jgi:hypothetical protein
MENSELKKCNYVLIRHGLSEFNILHYAAMQKYGRGSTEEIAVYKDMNLLDP